MASAWRFAGGGTATAAARILGVATIPGTAAVLFPGQRGGRPRRDVTLRCDWGGSPLPGALHSHQRTLGTGHAAMRSSALGFGCMGITAFYGDPMPDDDAVAIMKHAYANGITHFDTAEAYRCQAADGSIIFNETVVGRAIREIGRDKVQVATKYAPQLHGNQLTPELAVEACRASCQRLGVEQVDLYYVHRFADGVPVEQQARAMQAVLDAGLAKCIGVSEFSPENVRRFYAICPITCVQQEWSLLNRDLEEELVPTCRELGIGIVAYSPLSRALLTGSLRSVADLKPGDLRASRYPRLSADNIPKNAALADRVRAYADAFGVSSAQLALAWVSNQGEDVVPIPGTTQMKNLEDLLQSRNLKFTRSTLDELAAAIPTDTVVGDRYHGGTNANTFRAQM